MIVYDQHELVKHPLILQLASSILVGQRAEFYLFEQIAATKFTDDLNGTLALSLNFTELQPERDPYLCIVTESEIEVKYNEVQDVKSFLKYVITFDSLKDALSLRDKSESTSDLKQMFMSIHLNHKNNQN